MIEPNGDGWRQSACILCYVNCGVELGVEGRSIVRVRGDRAHPRSHGYLCQKAQRLHFYGEHADRLRTPLRRTASGDFEAISWGRRCPTSPPGSASCAPPTAATVSPSTAAAARATTSAAPTGSR